MKILSIILVFVVLSCNHDTPSDASMTHMKSPVILLGKKQTLGGGWFITVRDSTGRIVSYNSDCILSNTIGESRNVGDTLK